MQTSGEILKSKRNAQNLSIEAISRKLKIHSKYLVSLEEGDYSVFDSKVIARGFLIKYANFLKVDLDKVLAYWRRDFAVGDISKVPNQSRLNFSITPKMIGVFFVLLIVSAFIVFGYLQYLKIKQPPLLNIETPKNESNTVNSMLVLKGNTSTDAEVYLNDKSISTSDTGEFTENIYLSPGVNKFRVTSINSLGIENTKTITVYNNSPLEQPLDTNYSQTLKLSVLSDTSTFVEVKDGTDIIFTGFLLPSVVKEFRGNNLFLYTDTIESLSIEYNSKLLDLGEKSVGVFNENLDSFLEKQSESTSPSN